MKNLLSIAATLGRLITHKLYWHTSERVKISTASITLQLWRVETSLCADIYPPVAASQNNAPCYNTPWSSGNWRHMWSHLLISHNDISDHFQISCCSLWDTKLWIPEILLIESRHFSQAQFPEGSPQSLVLSPHSVLVSNTEETKKARNQQGQSVFLQFTSV